MADLNDSCYAYPQKHKYPIHTKEAALQSYNEYTGKMEQYSENTCKLINENFVKAAAYHGIKYPDLDVAEVPRETVTFTTEDNKNITFSKIASVHDIHQVYDNVIKNRHQIPFDTMQKIAMYAYNACEELGADDEISGKLQKLAGLGIGDKEEMLGQFLKRASLILLPDSVKNQFYQAYHKMDDCDQSTLYKKASEVASLLDSVDKIYDLEKHYGKELMAPEEVCFADGADAMIKEASDYLTVASTATILSKSALLDKKASVEGFLKDKYGYSGTTDRELFIKVATLSKIGLQALLDELDN